MESPDLKTCQTTLIASLLALAACAHRVSVPAPEVEPAPGGEIEYTPAQLSADARDTTWRTYAERDRQHHPARTIDVHVPSVPPVAGPNAPAVAPDSAPVAAPPAATPALARSAPPASAARLLAKFAAITPTSVNTEPSAADLAAEEGPVVVRTQVLLDRAHFSVGVINGRMGKNTALALYWFQDEHGLPTTGRLDSATYAHLAAAVSDEPVARVTITADMVKGPFVKIPESVYQQQDLPCLCYTSLWELLTERYHTTPQVLRQLNPGVAFDKLAPGDQIWVPNVEPAPRKGEEVSGPTVARIEVSKGGEYVHALTDDGSILYHFPTTLGSEYDPSPDGDWKVTGVQYDPPFRYDPTLFSDVPDSKPKAKLPPGPNSPVGVVWIALSKEHVGIHGTPHPETIGHAESHGCVRLTNWDALRLAARVKKGVPVSFMP